MLPDAIKGIVILLQTGGSWRMVNGQAGWSIGAAGSCLRIVGNLIG
jgi:hypothetical protein